MSMNESSKSAAPSPGDAAAAAPRLLLDLHEGVATLTLNRPAVRNAIDDGLRGELAQAIDHITRDRRVRSVVVTGAGAAFCAGGDIRAMQERAKAPPGDVAFNGWSRQQQTHRAVLALHELPKPTVAAVNGAATGLGADLALCCDFVSLADTATMAWSYVLRGLIPDGGGMYLLPRRVGLTIAKDLIFSGRTLDAQQALALGIAQRVRPSNDLLADAQVWAAQLGRGSATATALAKTLLNKSFELDVHEVFAQGSQAQGICYSSDEHRAAIAAFLNKTDRSGPGAGPR